jgi:pimeloyl-ACP methyl ester carboxylesterase
MRRSIVLVAAALVLASIVGLAAFEAYVYNQATSVDPADNVNLANRPDDFQVVGYAEFPDFDTSPYEMPVFEAVQLPSRAPGVQLAGWFIPGQPTAPAVVVTHGFRGCACEASSLVPAGMLHRNGFNVLMLDLRNHGRSSVTNGHAAYGSTEYLDVLGAWDWLASTEGFLPGRIGLFGVSMGAAASLIAFGHEARVPAAFVDSPFYTVEQLVGDSLVAKGYPRWLAPGGLWMGRLVSGDDLYAHAPTEGYWQDAGRPLYVVHSTRDQRIALYHQQEYAELARASGANVTAWLAEGAGHLQSSFLLPAEYERRLSGFFREALSAADG